MIIRFLLVTVMLVLVGCGQSDNQTGEPTRSPAEVIETGVARTQTPRTTVIIPTLVPTRIIVPTAAPTEIVPPTDVPPTPSATTEPPTPTDIATVTPLPTNTPTEIPSPTVSATLEPTPTIVEPSATPTTVEPSVTSTEEVGIDPLPGDFTVVHWSGLLIPVPDGYDDKEITQENETLNGVPVIAKLLIEQTDSANQPERPNPMTYTVVQFQNGAEAWLDVVRSAPNGQLAIDNATVKPTNVAGFLGQTYESNVPGTGQPLNYVVEFARDKLLLISIDRSYPEQQQAVTAIERDTSSTATPVTTITPLAGGQLTGEIAYVLDRDIWLYDLSTTQSRQLTKLGTVGEFTWSPDGRQIAFAAGDENDTHIWTVDVRNGKQKQVTEGTEADMFPAYSPDGTLFFLRRSISDEAATIDIMRHKGSEDTVVHSEPGGLVGPTALHFHNEREWALAVSTGRGRYVLLGELGKDASKDLAETYLPPTAGCAYDIAWHEHQALVLSSIDCIPHENSTISRLDLVDRGVGPTTVHTGAGISSVDWAADGAIVWSRNETGGQSDGIWVIVENNEPERVLEEGVQPMWRP